MLTCMKLQNVIEKVVSLSPEHLAEPWDRVGLHVGRIDGQVRRGLLCIDLTEDVMQEAVANQVELIVAYHPPIFKPLMSLTERTAKSRIVLTAAEHAMAIYSPHTALDAVEGGVNDWLAAGVGAGRIEPIRPASRGAQVKLVVFVPEDDADRLRAALSEAGAGRIGRYSKCSFSVPGQGTFQGDATTHPVRGRAQRFERVAEWRMEMIVPRANLAAVMETVRTHHPYEEPAFDLYPLEIEKDTKAGQGRVVTLNRAVSLKTLVARLKEHLGLSHLQVGQATGGGRIKRVGLCAGAGGSLLEDAGAVDAFFTGEMRHHDVLAAVAEGTAVILAGHTQTERPYLKVYRKRLTKLAPKVQWRVSRADRAVTALR